MEDKELNEMMIQEKVQQNKHNKQLIKDVGIFTEVNRTKMHSSRMRTGRTLTVFRWRTPPPENLEEPPPKKDPPENLEEPPKPPPRKFGGNPPKN